MNTRTSVLRSVPLLALVAWLILPVAADSQCITNITNGPGTFGTPAYIYIGKTITNATMCTLTGFNNIIGCAPGGFPPTGTGAMNAGSYVSASALTASTNPFCAWNCNCGQVTISGADGLPVELMEFSVE